MFRRLFNNQLGAAVLAELLIALLVLGMAGFGGYKIHQGQSQKTPKCGDKACFEQKFTSCEKAIFTDTSNSEGNIYLEIYGKNDVGCKMLLRYTSGNPAWLNKNLICNFDNSMKYEDSVASTVQNIVGGKDNSCEGPFLDLLKTLPPQQ